MIEMSTIKVEMLISGRLGIVQSEVEAVLALLWREQHEKVAKNTKNCSEHLGFRDFIFRALYPLSSLETHADAQNIPTITI